MGESGVVEGDAAGSAPPLLEIDTGAPSVCCCACAARHCSTPVPLPLRCSPFHMQHVHVKRLFELRQHCATGPGLAEGTEAQRGSSTSVRVSELLGRLDSASEQLDEFGRTPKGVQTPAPIRKAGADLWESTRAQTPTKPMVDRQIVDEPTADEHDAATRLQAARRGVLARRDYSAMTSAASHIQAVHRGRSVRRQGLLMVLITPEEASPVPHMTAENQAASSPTYAISMEAARQRRRVAQTEISRLKEQIASAQQQQSATAGRRRKQLANAQSALDVKGQHLKARLVQMQRSVEATEYAFDQSEIIAVERDAAITALQNKLRFQEFQTVKEGEFAEQVAEALRKEIAAAQATESELVAVKATAEAADSEARAAQEELAGAEKANAACQTELKAAVHAERRATRAKATLQQEIKLRNLQLKQERQELVVSQQELNRARQRLTQYGGEIDAKMAILERAMRKAQNAQDAAYQLKREAEDLAVKSKQVVAKQSNKITLETDEMNKAEEKALRLLRKQAMQLRKEQLALEAAEAIKPPPGAPQPKHTTTADSLPTISTVASQSEQQVGNSTATSKATKERAPAGQEKQLTCVGNSDVTSNMEVSAAVSSGRNSEIDAHRQTLMRTAPRRRNTSRRQPGSRRHIRRRVHKQHQHQPKPQPQQQAVDRQDVTNSSKTSRMIAKQQKDVDIEADEAALSQHTDTPGEAIPVVSASTKTTVKVPFQADEVLVVESAGFSRWGTMESFASNDQLPSAEVKTEIATMTATDEDQSDGNSVLLDEGELASIGAHATQNMAAQLMRQAPSLSFLRFMSTSERMQYLRPLTPGDGALVNNAKISRAHSGKRPRRTRARASGGKPKRSTTESSRSGRSDPTSDASRTSDRDGDDGHPVKRRDSDSRERLESHLEKIDAVTQDIEALTKEGEVLTLEIQNDLDRDREEAELQTQTNQLQNSELVGEISSPSAYNLQDVIDMAHHATT